MTTPRSAEAKVQICTCPIRPSMLGHADDCPLYPRTERIEPKDMTREQIMQAFGISEEQVEEYMRQFKTPRSGDATYKPQTSAGKEASDLLDALHDSTPRAETPLRPTVSELMRAHGWDDEKDAATWDDTLFAILRILDRAKPAPRRPTAKDPVLAERERIVAWLRGWANEKHPIEAGEVLFSPAGRGLILMGASAIENGEHASSGEAQRRERTIPEPDEYDYAKGRLDEMSERSDEIAALYRVVSTARAVEAYLTNDAREVQCDVVNDEHEQLRSALHNLDTLDCASEGKDTKDASGTVQEGSEGREAVQRDGGRNDLAPDDRADEERQGAVPERRAPLVRREDGTGDRPGDAGHLLAANRDGRGVTADSSCADELPLARSFLIATAGGPWVDTHEQKLAMLLARVRGEEREACAKVAEMTMPTVTGSGGIGIECIYRQEPNPYAAACAANIRARTAKARTGGA